MQLIAKRTAIILLIIVMAMSVVACNPSEYAETDPVIIGAQEFSKVLEGDDAFQVIDMRKAADYAKGHVEGAVNIVKDDILMSSSVDNMLTSRSNFEQVMREAGIKDNVPLYIYDNDRMSAARLFWSFMVYGNENAKVIDGGYDAILEEGIGMVKTTPEMAESNYKAGEKNDAYLASMKQVRAQVNEPDPNVILLDVRTDQEYIDNGKIPSSIMMDFKNIFYADNTFKNVQTVRIDFIDNGMRPENEIIMYCQTSMRAAPVFLALYNAGYRNIRIYDGAFLEWSSYPANPIDIMEGGGTLPNANDAS